LALCCQKYMKQIVCVCVREREREREREQQSDVLRRGTHVYCYYFCYSFIFDIVTSQCCDWFSVGVVGAEIVTCVA
jgi:hypothetical protein